MEKANPPMSLFNKDKSTPKLEIQNGAKQPKFFEINFFFNFVLKSLVSFTLSKA